MSEYLVEDTVKCDECGSRNLDRDETRGEIVCQDCGLVLEDNVIDQGAEWRVFSPEQGAVSYTHLTLPTIYSV